MTRTFILSFTDALTADRSAAVLKAAIAGATDADQTDNDARNDAAALFAALPGLSCNALGRAAWAAYRARRTAWAVARCDGDSAVCYLGDGVGYVGTFRAHYREL